MPGGFGIFIVAVVAVGAIVMAVLSARWRRQRMEELQRLARSLGWEFSPGPYDGGGGLFSGGGRADGHPYILFEMFDKGHDREFRNVMHGETVCGAPPGEAGVTMSCEAGDYKWVTGSGKNRRTHHVSYLLFDLSHDLGATPSLVIRPEGFGDRILAAFGGDDIDFESEEFSRMFHVSGSDRRFAYAVIDPRMMEFLMSAPSAKVAMNAGWGLIVSGKESWSPAEFNWVIAWVRAFMEHWPQYLVKELRDGVPGWNR